MTCIRRCFVFGMASASIACTSLFVPCEASAQNWPAKPIRLIVPVAAGTATDAVGRLLATHLKKNLGQAVIVDNIAGAGATIGTLQLSRAVPDGYTFMVGGNTTHSAARALVKSVTYDPIRDFTPVARIGKLPTLLVTNSKQPFKTMQSMVAYAKNNPGKLNYGHGNAVGQIIGETLKRRLAIDITRVPYASNPSAITNLLGNEIQLMVPDMLSALPQIQAGKMIPLAVGEAKRSPLLPDTPTINESVVRGFEVLPWLGIYGPKNTPPRIAERLSAVLQMVVVDPVFVDSLRKIGIETYFLSGAAFKEFAIRDVIVWESLAREAGIQPQ